ncbi:MAG: hypothetical protein FWG85_07165 [Bacteroidetes bacterium]|nr:hypothetical protein [Bacteroidota bacterium]
METLELERNQIKTQNENLYDEDGYLIASLEEGLADERAGRGRTYKNWDEFIRQMQWEINNGI